MSGYQPKKYKVKALSLGGRGNKIFKHGDIVSDLNFKYGQTSSLVANGFLKRIGASNGENIKFKEDHKIKLVIGTMMWGRFELFQFWCDHIKRLQKECPEIEIIPISVGSEGYKSKSICESNGIHYLEHENLPLRNKANARLKFAKQFNPDYIMFLGSDDIISTSLLKEYHTHMLDGVHILEVMDLYYFDRISKRSAYCEGYISKRRKGEPMAVARCISSYVAEEFNWELWNTNINSSPDANINKNLRSTIFSNFRLNIKNKHLVLDIKGEGINVFKPNKPNWELIDTSIIKNFLPKKEFQKLIEL